MTKRPSITHISSSAQYRFPIHAAQPTHPVDDPLMLKLETTRRSGKLGILPRGSRENDRFKANEGGRGAGNVRSPVLLPIAWFPRRIPFNWRSENSSMIESAFIVSMEWKGACRVYTYEV